MNTNEIELWEIAKKTWMNETIEDNQDWRGVVQAVIAEHERRWAEQVKSEPAHVELGPEPAQPTETERLATVKLNLNKSMPDIPEENLVLLCRAIQSYKSALDAAHSSLTEMLHYSTDDGIPEEYWTDEWRAAVTRARQILSTEEPTKSTPCK